MLTLTLLSPVHGGMADGRPALGGGAWLLLWREAREGSLPGARGGGGQRSWGRTAPCGAPSRKQIRVTIGEKL